MVIAPLLERLPIKVIELMCKDLALKGSTVRAS
jgi:hypothetical protein